MWGPDRDERGGAGVGRPPAPPTFALRVHRRVLASLAVLGAGLFLPPVATVVLLAVLWIEHFVRVDSALRRPAAQTTLAWLFYLAFPVTMAVPLATGAANPVHDGLLAFLLLYQVKWVYAPRRDFHWIAAVLLFALVVLRTHSVWLGVLLGLFSTLSIPYLTGFQGLAIESIGLDEYLDQVRHRRRARAVSLMWLLPIVALGATAFYLLPRSPESRYGTALQPGVYTALTDELQLHKAGEIKRDYKLVARVALASEAPPERGLYLRAGHLELLSDATWSFLRVNVPDRPEVELVRVSGGRAGGALRYAQGEEFLRDELPAECRVVAFQMTLLDSAMAFLAVPEGTREVWVPTWLSPLGNGFHELPDAHFPLVARGTAIADYGEATGWRSLPHLRVAAQRPTADEWRLLTSWPGTASDRSDLVTLGATWLAEVEGPPTVQRTAARFTQYLRRHYRYDLDPLRPPIRANENPVVYFLLDLSYAAGHCEMFAASLVALLRVRGIPARVVNGFRVSEFDPVSGEYLVRRSNAHSWVEVWTEDEGWMSFDPTPEQVFRSYQGRIVYKMIRETLEEADRLWQVAVVNFDYRTQEEWLSHLLAFAAGSRERLSAWLADALGPFAWARRRIGGSIILSRAFWATMLVEAIILGMLLARLGRARRQGRHAQRRELGWFWKRVERLLARSRGSRRTATETYRHALWRLLPARTGQADPALVVEILGYVEDCAYGGEPTDEQRQLELLDRLERARRDDSQRFAGRPAPIT